jgi:hypothetical protein
MKRINRMLALLLVMGSVGPAWGEQDMKFSGTLVAPPPCIINDGNVIDVDFGTKVGINRVDGVNYLKTVNYTITCDPSATLWDMTLTLNGTNATWWDNATLQTDVADLGIQITQSGRPFELSKPIAIDPKNPPTLQAVPVKKAGSTLTAQPFQATATLTAIFQ